jgi:hypothetical protein
MPRDRYVAEPDPWDVVLVVDGGATACVMLRQSKTTGPKMKLQNTLHKANTHAWLAPIDYPPVKDDGRACEDNQDLPSHRDVVMTLDFMVLH